jgi:adenine-specific DNA-methyltransferase
VTKPEDDIAKFDLRSEDVAEARRLELLRIFPEAHTESGGINFEALRLSLGDAVQTGPEGFGMSWPGKAECAKTIQRQSVATLLPVEGESVNWDTTQNVIIEGDNLEVLKVLQKAYLGKVKMIYIDPPYNTGNDFIYPDNYTESLKTYLQYTQQVDDEGRKFSTSTESSGRFHSKWMNMMYPRLKISRDMLTDDGVVFMSIGDEELANSILILDEVFGADNRVGTLTRITKTTSDAGVHFAPSTDFVLVYAKNIEILSEFSVPLTEAQVADYRKQDERGRYKLVGFYQASLTLERSRNARYFIEAPDGSKCIPPEGKRWRTVLGTYKEFLAQGGIEFVEVPSSPLIDEAGNRSKWNVYTKQYLSRRAAEGRTPRTFIDDCHNHLGAKDVSDLGIPFSFPKPVKLIQTLMEMVGLDRNAIVMDFFAGSGTVGHAVYAANAQDGGHRRFILVQLPEPIILEKASGDQEFSSLFEITVERVRRASKLFSGGSNQTLLPEISNKLDLGFRAFKLSESNFAVWDANAIQGDEKNLEQQLFAQVEHVLAGRNNHDILFELMLKSRYELTTPVEQVKVGNCEVWKVAGGEMVAVIDAGLAVEVIREIASWKPVSVVILDRCFGADDSLKANARKIFEDSKVDLKTV